MKISMHGREFRTMESSLYPTDVQVVLGVKQKYGSRVASRYRKMRGDQIS